MSSRTTVARYIANTLAAGGNRQQVIAQAAAWLKTSGKQRQAEYLVKDVSKALADKDYLFVQFTTARPIAPDVSKYLQSYISKTYPSRRVECEFVIKPSVIGGVLITTPHGDIDATVRNRLSQLLTRSK